MNEFKNKKVIITGGGKGIGNALSNEFYELGAKVLVIDNDRNLEKKFSDYNKSMLTTLIMDLTKEESYYSSLSDLLLDFGEDIDILINCAGIILRKPGFDTEVMDFKKIFNINVLGGFHISREIAKLMKDHGGGKIINMGSIVSDLGGYNAVAYSSSKGAVNQLTKSLSNEWAQHNIQVNALAPGYIETDMNNDIVEDKIRKPQIDERIPAKRWGTTSDLIGPVLFLSSSKSDYVTGTLIPVDGGVLGR